MSVTSLSSVSRTIRGSSWAPQVMSQPFGLAGWATVANQVMAGDLPDDFGQQAGGEGRMGRTVRSGWLGSRPSRRKMAWKWISPRRWNSATLA